MLRRPHVSPSAAKPVLLCVSGTIADDVEHQIASGRRPRADYLELSRALNADLIDYAAARISAGRIGKLLERVGGANLMLAFACWKQRKRYQAIVTDGEQVGLPLAALLKATPGHRPRHLMIVHILSVPKKTLILDWFGVQSCIDTFVTYSSWQKQFIEQRWKLPSERVVLTPFMVDQNFFAPTAVQPRPRQRPQICAVGLERRDYPTLLAAAQGLDADVVIAAASPWSKIKDTSTQDSLPENVTVAKFSQYDLRQLYADSAFLVMPLQPVDFQAGITAILEAMAMGKAVICSRIPGQTDAIIDQETGLYVEPGNPTALRSAIEALLSNPSRSKRMGTSGRHIVETRANLDTYANGFATVVREAINVSADGRSQDITGQ